MSITPMIYLDGRGVTRDEVLRVAQQAATGFEQLGVSEGDTVVTSANFLIDAESNLKAALKGLSDAGAPK